MSTESIAAAIQSAGRAITESRIAEPYDYSTQIKELCSQLSDIHFQLERIADNLEATEGKP